MKSIKDKYGDGLSYSDLIVLAGNVALENASGAKLNLGINLFRPIIFTQKFYFY